MNLKETLKKVRKNGGVIAVIFAILLIVPIALFLQGLLIYLVYNYLVLWIIPTLPVIGYIKACVIGIILCFIGSFFKKH